LHNTAVKQVRSEQKKFRLSSCSSKTAAVDQFRPQLTPLVLDYTILGLFKNPLPLNHFPSRGLSSSTAAAAAEMAQVVDVKHKGKDASGQVR
jgi:hypothetical protein